MTTPNEPPDAGAKDEKLKRYVTGEILASDSMADKYYYLAADVDAALTASRQECERLKAERDHWQREAGAYSRGEDDSMDEVADLRTQLAAKQDECERLREQADKAEGNAKCRAETINELCNIAWEHVYGKGKTDWEYPVQAIRHLYTYADEWKAKAEAAQAERDAARAEALEEAAKICDQAYLENMNGHGDIDTSPEAIAAAIRALMGEKGEGEKYGTNRNTNK